MSERSENPDKVKDAVAAKVVEGGDDDDAAAKTGTGTTEEEDEMDETAQLFPSVMKEDFGGQELKKLDLEDVEVEKEGLGALDQVVEEEEKGKAEEEEETEAVVSLLVVCTTNTRDVLRGKRTRFSYFSPRRRSFRRR